MSLNPSISDDISINDQVTLNATFPERLVLNEGWPVKVTLRNESRERVTVSLRKDSRSDIMVEVRNAAGERLEPSAFGKQHLPGVPIEGTWADDVSAKLTHLEPGDSHTWKITLDKWFDFAPGEYAVEMSVPVEPLGMIRHVARIRVLSEPGR